MKRLLTIAAVQLPSDAPGKTNTARLRANNDSAEYWLKEAGKRGANIACLGETFNMVGIEKSKRIVFSLTRNAHAETLKRFGPIAKKHRMAIIAPITAIIENLVRNVAIVIDEKGAFAGQYFKVHCIEN